MFRFLAVALFATLASSAAWADVEAFCSTLHEQAANCLKEAATVDANGKYRQKCPAASLAVTAAYNSMGAPDAKPEFTSALKTTYDLWMRQSSELTLKPSESKNDYVARKTKDDEAVQGACAKLKDVN